MKLSIWSALIATAAVTLGGCATPQPPQTKNRTAPPASSPQIYVSGDSVPKSSPTPAYLDIDDETVLVVEENMETTLPPMIFINDRIFEYGRKLDRWKELDAQSVTMQLGEEEATQMVRCFRRLQGVMNGYSDLRSAILQSQKVVTSKDITNKDIFDLQKNDLIFTESACGRLLAETDEQSTGWEKREKGADLAQLETLIDRNAKNNENEEIVRVWGQIPEFQLGRVGLRTKILYGNALMHLHQEEKASEIYLQVVKQMSDSDEQATDLVSLRKLLADLYTASGNYREATIQYNKISDDYVNIGRLEEWSKLQLSILDRSMEGSPELLEYSTMLRNFLGFIPEQDGYKIVWEAEKFLNDYPYSPVSSNVDIIKEEAQKKADGWLNGFMAEVDAFAAEKKFAEALELLVVIPTDIISPEQQLDVKAKKDELLLAEAVDRETNKMEKIQELQRKWNNGLLLARDGKYDEAIVTFTHLLDTEYAIKAEDKISEMALEAAKADRREAANLFIRFTKTTDIESKKKLLIESRKLLKDILVKYPEVEIAAKVAGNIERVEQEMNALDPNLLILADQAEMQERRVDGVDQAFEATAIQAGEEATPVIIETDMDVPLYQ